MASGFLNREVTVSLTSIDPAVMKREFIAFAKQSVADVISSGQAPATYDTYVNNHPGPVESVTLPGPVVFVFNNWSAVIESALQDLQRRVPHKSGDYSRSYVVLVNQRPTTDFSDVPSDAEIVILNRQPYTRKLETAHSKWRTTKYFNGTKNAINSRYSGVFNAQVMFLNVPAGLIPGVPYVLQTGGPLVAAKQNRRSSAFRMGRAHLSRRKDLQAGQPISYPALVITAA